MNGTLGTIEACFSAEVLLILANLVDAIKRQTEAIAANTAATTALLPLWPASAPHAPSSGAGDLSAGQASLGPPVGGPSPDPALPSDPDLPQSTGGPRPVEAVIQLGRPTKTWTPERVTILARDYPAGVPVDDIVVAVNALPGNTVDNKGVGIKAAYFGLRRAARPILQPSAPSEPGGALPEFTESTPSLAGQPLVEPGLARDPQDFLDVSSQNLTPAAPLPASCCEAPSKAPDRPRAARIPADREQIVRWATERGMTMQSLDLAAVNARADRIGHPGFELRDARGQRAA